MSGARRRAGWLAGLLSAAATLLPATPARALQEVLIRIPLLGTSFSLRVSELRDPEALRRGSSDLAELDRASDGAVSRRLRSLLEQPVPLGLTQLADGSVGSPLLEQAMLVLSSLGSVEGLEPDLSGATLRQALDTASRHGQPTLLDLIAAIPGRRVTLDLGQAQAMAVRMARQRRQSDQLLSSLPAAAPAVLRPGQTVRQRSLSLPVSHRPEPLALQIIEPIASANGRLVLISHGLWDSPDSFISWGRLLAGQGYTVVLPRHPGSDHNQQRAVLAGTAPPPDARELARRPLDLRAVIDGLDQLQLATPADPQRVVVLGHSWGATTALQLAGVRPSDTDLRRRCNDLQDPERNLSWTLQCSWRDGVRQAAITDPRVIAVAAVSPPVSLLFPRGSGADLQARVLLVGGSRDWVVPPDPEAVTPMRLARRSGNQLVLVQGGDHFNLRPGQAADGGVLGALLLAWTDAAFQAGTAVRPAPAATPLLQPGAWGHAAMPLVDATPGL